MLLRRGNVVKINENKTQFFVQIGDHIQYSMLRPYVTLFISEVELRILNIDSLLIKVSITDGRRLILHHSCKMAGETQDIEC